MLFKRKLETELLKLNGNYDIALKNIIVNGKRKGCSGFVTNPKNGRVVWVDTEESCGSWLRGKVLVRYAKSTSDYTGDRNNWPKELECAKAIHLMLAVNDGNPPLEALGFHSSGYSNRTVYGC